MSIHVSEGGERGNIDVIEATLNSAPEITHSVNKFVHFIREGTELVAIGEHSIYDHWKLTGLKRTEARKLDAINAGMLARGEGGVWFVLSGSGEMQRDGRTLLKNEGFSLAELDEIDKETCDFLNRVYRGRYDFKPGWA